LDKYRIYREESINLTVEVLIKRDEVYN